MTERVFPPREEWEPRASIREDCFYVMDLPVDEDLNEHARLNEGALRIEDGHGNPL